jgi:hypothetical protein
LRIAREQESRLTQLKHNHQTRSVDGLVERRRRVQVIVVAERLDVFHISRGHLQVTCFDSKLDRRKRPVFLREW